MSAHPPPRKPSKRIKQLSVAAFLKACTEPLQLTVVAGQGGLNRQIRDRALNRPALALVGFFENFANERVQLFGAGEIAYLRSLDPERQQKVLFDFLGRDIPCVIVSRDLEPGEVLRQMADVANVPLLRSTLSSKDFMTSATLHLEELFAPRSTEHGTMLDIKGIGTLLRGASGVGKSEAALALIERGHSLVADDFVLIRLIDEKELRATSSPLNRGYMECRGIGIVNIASLFGIRAVRLESTVHLVVTFEEWSPGMEEDRTGLEQETYELLGLQVPHITLPVRPGRDLARLVEVAALVRALKMMGHDPAREFNDRLIAHMHQQPLATTPPIV